jgi:hypothetical protein
MIASMEPHIQQVTDELFDVASARGELELMADIANALPVIVIAEILGVPRNEYAKFKTCCDGFVAGQTNPRRTCARELVFDGAPREGSTSLNQAPSVDWVRLDSFDSAAECRDNATKLRSFTRRMRIKNALYRSACGSVSPPTTLAGKQNKSPLRIAPAARSQRALYCALQIRIALP